MKTNFVSHFPIGLDEFSNWDLRQEVEALPLPLKTKSRILVIDDDPLFIKKLEYYAKNLPVTLIPCSSVSELIDKRAGQKFDLAIIDYYFEEITGIHAALILGNIPTMMVSEVEQSEIGYQQWPIDVKGFVHKGNGPDYIVKKALEMIQSNVLSRQNLSGNYLEFGSLKKWEAEQWLVIVAMLVVLLTGLYFFTPTEGSPDKILPGEFYWDKNEHSAFLCGQNTRTVPVQKKDLDWNQRSLFAG